jgi:fermentation-respiration switch protein FrsA (DUF1100 family)
VKLPVLGLKEHFLLDFATRFQAEGFTLLIYDHRCWGASEGTPRSHVEPYLQTRDMVDAFDYATALPDVDPGRIVFWGSSLSGGNAICAAAIEKRVAAVVAQVPFVSGELSSGTFFPLVSTFLREPGAMRGGAPPALVPMTCETMEEALNGTSKGILKDSTAVAFNQKLERRG